MLPPLLSLSVYARQIPKVHTSCIEQKWLYLYTYDKSLKVTYTQKTTSENESSFPDVVLMH